MYYLQTFGSHMCIIMYVHLCPLINMFIDIVYVCYDLEMSVGYIYDLLMIWDDFAMTLG